MQDFQKFTKIVFLTLFTHIVILLFLFYGKRDLLRKDEKQKIIVNNFTIKDPIIIKKRSPIPIKQKCFTKRAIKKTTSLNSKILSDSGTTKKELEKAQKLFQNFQNFQNFSQKSLNIKIPTKIDLKKNHPQLDQDNKTLTFEEKLILYLKSELILPEIGFVKMSLKIKNSLIEEIKILSTESKKNKRNFLEKVKNLNFLKKFQEEKNIDLIICFENENL